MRLLRGFGWLVFVLLLLVFAGVLFARKVSNPLVSGSLNLRGLSGPVTITRDAWGVPRSWGWAPTRLSSSAPTTACCRTWAWLRSHLAKWR